MAQLSTVRPDMDIEEDVASIIARYPPLASDRHHIHVNAEDGIVYLSGNTSTPINRRYLVDRVLALPGVAGVNAEKLFDDATINLEVGQVIPTGVIANAHDGAVVLSGERPADPDTLAQRIAQIPGVTRVVTIFNEDEL
jgi:osmotically-inducible protein OsmY